MRGGGEEGGKLDERSKRVERKRGERGKGMVRNERMKYA